MKLESIETFTRILHLIFTIMFHRLIQDRILSTMCVIDKSGSRIEIVLEVIPKLNQRNLNHVNPNCSNA